MVFPHGAPLSPNTFHHLWGHPPTMGAPPTPLSSHKALPPQGGAPQNSPKTAPTNRGILSPHAGTRCFPRLFLLKKLKGPKTFPAPSKIILDMFQNIFG